LVLPLKLVQIKKKYTYFSLSWLQFVKPQNTNIYLCNADLHKIN